MKKGVYILFVFLLLIASCQKKNPFAEYPEWILGEWVTSEDDPNFFYADGLNFISKDSCEIRPGYFKDSYRLISHQYLGNSVKYQLRNDTLNLFDLEENCWVEFKIQFLSPDTMKITYQAPNTTKMPYQYPDAMKRAYKGKWNNATFKYARAIYPVSDENLFDQIIIDIDFFEYKTISIDKSGNLFFLGKYRTFFDGLHTSEEGKRAFKQIELLFREANAQVRFIDGFPQKLDTIEDSWMIPTITFVKDHKMATIIGPVLGNLCEEYEGRDYHSREFKWAYRQSLYLEQQMPVQPFDASKYVLDSTFYSRDFPRFVFFRNGIHTVSLYSSEYFYLWTQLLQAKKVEVNFTPIYKIVCDLTNKYIQSDGRYYRYQTDKGETITLDLGFNFIEENDLGDKFEDRRK